MEEKRSRTKYPSEEMSSAYSDAYYSEAPQSGRASYGYSPAQCYARASEEPCAAEASPPKHRGLAGLVLVSLATVIALGFLAAGGALLLHRADAASGEATSREIYSDYAEAAETEEQGDGLALNRAGEEAPAELTAEEIYNIACRSTVGVTIPGYAQNIFGQTSASTVTGTGIVLSEDGYILTNFHVIEDAYVKGAAICVITYDGAEHEAEVVGVETDSDLAVLKIEADGLTAAPIGDSASLRVGQTIYAVGNPLGELTYTMTSGIVSALDRNVTTDVNVTVNMFQIDAAVNNGNSGGPVFNAYGQVIGVVTAKYSQYGMEGLGFAIPVDDACRIACDLVEKGYVSGKAYLGLTLATISPSVAKYYDLVQGVFVYDVEEGSCAEAAGLRSGDIITAIDGETITTSNELAQTVKEYHAGDSAELTIVRDQECAEVTVVFDEELPAGQAAEEKPQTPSSGEITFHED